MNLDEQIAGFVDDLGPALTLDDVAARRPDPIILEPVPSGAPSQPHLGPDHESLDVIPLRDARPRRHRRAPQWAAAAAAVAAVASIASYALQRSGTAPTPTSVTSREVDFHVDDFDGDELNPDEAAVTGTVDINVAAEGESRGLLKTTDGFVRLFVSADGTDGLQAERSADGMTWEPAEIVGLTSEGDTIVATGSTFTTQMLTPEMTAVSMLSRDGLHWVAVPATERDEFLPDSPAVIAAAGLEGDDYLAIAETNACAPANPADTACEAQLPTTALWRIDASGEFVEELPGPNEAALEGLVPVSLFELSAGATVGFAQSANDPITMLATTADGTNWDITTPPLSAPGAPFHLSASSGGVDYLAGFEAHPTVSTDRGTSWTETAPFPIDDGFSSSIDTLAAGPAGVVVAINVEDTNAPGLFESESASAEEEPSDPEPLTAQGEFERDGYVLAVERSIDQGAERYELRGPDGTVLAEGTQVWADGEQWQDEGVELVADDEGWLVRFFDPKTGEEYVSFPVEEIESTLFDQATQAGSPESATTFTLAKDGYTLSGTFPYGDWTLTDASGAIVADIASPLEKLAARAERGADDGYRLDPLTWAITFDDPDGPSAGSPQALVTFELSEIEAAAETTLMQHGIYEPDGVIYLSKDEGRTWQEVGRYRGYVNSLALGDAVVLVETQLAHVVTLRLPTD